MDRRKNENIKSKIKRLIEKCDCSFFVSAPLDTKTIKNELLFNLIRYIATEIIFFLPFYWTNIVFNQNDCLTFCLRAYPYAQIK